MQRYSVQSSNISSIGYDETSKALEVTFKSGGKYTYSDVPKEKFEAFKSAKSVGSYFHSAIKNAHPCVKG